MSQPECEPEPELHEKIAEEIERLSGVMHEASRHRAILVRSATQLRLGRSPEFVLAEIREQSEPLHAALNGLPPSLRIITAP